MISFILFIFFYLLPSVLAVSRNHKNAAPIVVINILLGWTLIGWVVSLAWSLTNKE